MFNDKIAELNRQTELHPPTFEKRTYTVSEIQDILGIGRNAAYFKISGCRLKEQKLQCRPEC